MRICLIPGSFDPMTLGHRDVVERACKMFDRVIVTIMQNAEKQGRFTFDQRAEIAKLTIEGLNAEVIVKDGYCADFAKEVGACAYVKGVRNPQDLLYENTIYDFNIDRNPECDTVYLPAKDIYEDLSSTCVYNKIVKGESLDGLMAPKAIEYIRAIIK